MSYLVTEAALQVSGSELQPQGNINMSLTNGNISMGSGTSIGVSGTGGNIQFDSSSNWILIGSGASESSIKLGSGTTANIYDSNGNEIIVFSNAVTSAVNYLTIAPAATGVAPSLGAGGVATDVDLSLKAQGAGAVRINDGAANGGGGLEIACGSSGTSSLILKGGLSSTSDDTIIFPDGFTASVGQVLKVASGGVNSATLEFAADSSGTTYSDITSSGFSGLSVMVKNTIYAVNDLSSTISNTLPTLASSTDGDTITVIDANGGATASVKITINAATSTTINGASSYEIDSAYQAVTLKFNSTTSKWNIV